MAPKEPLAAYLVRGDDPILLNEAVRGLITELLGDVDHSLAVTEVDAGEPGEADAGEVVATAVDAAQTPPLLTDRRVVVIRQVGALSTAALGPVLAYLEEPMPTTSLVLVGGGGRVASGLAGAVKKVGTVLEAGAPRTSRARTAWLDDALRGAPVRLDARARAAVEQHLGEDLGRLANLLEALAAAFGRDSRLSADDVTPFLGGAGAVPPWELTDAIDRGDTGRALTALHRMTEAGGRHPLQVMSVLHAHYERMLRLDGSGARSESDAARVLGISGSTFPAKKAMEQGRRLGRAGVTEAIRLLADADFALRGGREWPDVLVLEVLVEQLSRLRAPRPTRRA